MFLKLFGSAIIITEWGHFIIGSDLCFWFFSLLWWPNSNGFILRYRSSFGYSICTILSLGWQGSRWNFSCFQRRKIWLIWIPWAKVFPNRSSMIIVYGFLPSLSYNIASTSYGPTILTYSVFRQFVPWIMGYDSFWGVDCIVSVDRGSIIWSEGIWIWFWASSVHEY